VLGRVQLKCDASHLLIGPVIDFDMWSGSAIILAAGDCTEMIGDPANKIYSRAVSIGVSPHFEHMNISMAHPTRLRIRTNAKLILEPNTCILKGCYIAIAPKTTINIGTESYIAHGVCINIKSGLTIGKNVMIGHESTIMDYDGHPIFYSQDELDAYHGEAYGGKSIPITIEDNVWIGFRTTILKGVKIGTGSIIGANSCVTTDIPPNSIAAGNPAKIIKGNIVWKRY
tara:strand:- start:2493 stop:3176 length:684 start_codon:yes stop_codon:yes gene_type:complete